MGITIQFRGFGVYPNPSLVELPSDHPQVNRMKDWASVRQREQRDKLRNSRPIKGPGLRHKGVPAATARGRARGSEGECFGLPWPRDTCAAPLPRSVAARFFARRTHVRCKRGGV